MFLQTMVKSFEVTELPVRSAKFIARKQWVVAGADDMFIRVYNYNTMDKIKVFEAHTDYIRCVAVHPTLPYVLSSSDDMLIKLWDWDKGWICTQIFEGHSHYVMQVCFNPKDTNTFASASLDRTVKIWNLGSPDPNFTLDAHLKGVNCVDYFTGGDRPYLITGSDDHTAKVWDYQTKSCVQTLEGHTHNVSAVCFHPELPIIITGSEDGTVRIWHATTYRLENTLNYGLERVWAVGYIKGSRRTIMIKCREEPVASHGQQWKNYMAKHNEIQTVNIRQLVTDGERLPLTVKELGSCDLYPQSLKHNPNGRFVVVCGDGEYIIYTALAWRNRSFGSALNLFVIDGESPSGKEKKSIRPTFSAERILADIVGNCSNDFIAFMTGLKDVVSSYLEAEKPVDEQGVRCLELLHEIMSAFELDMGYHHVHLDRPIVFVRYLASQSRVYLIDKELMLWLHPTAGLIEYKTLVMRGIVARFLDPVYARGSLEIAIDPDYRFDLAVQAWRLDDAKLEMAEECLSQAMDLSGLLLLYSALGDAEGITRLASLAKEQGKNNVAYLCLFMLVNNRIPEAALMARSYLPSKVSEIVAIWRNDLNKVNPKAAEGIYPPAEEYLSHAEKPNATLVEVFKAMQIAEEDLPVENGDPGHEAMEEDVIEDVQEDEDVQEEEVQEEAVEVDLEDSTDSGVLVNGNDGEEQWGTKNEGTPSA
ncbi:Coatomer subunit beta'-1 [Ananas comosus]|uniref:Beta'-coat protein n=1 Tax=Ananas comosus TaxID=4615 RepID=A0A199URS1_ANACO|nr:Coatomer subunit beta'-1 [Ananas comosus]